MRAGLNAYHTLRTNLLRVSCRTRISPLSNRQHDFGSFLNLGADYFA
jgi:hypothetical protein